MKNSKTLSLGLIERRLHSSVHEKIELNVSDYPELEGLSDKEIIYYITENCHNMKSTNPEIYNSLWQELSEKDIVIEKMTEEKQDICKYK